MEKKYELSGNTKRLFEDGTSVTVYQIRALKDFGNIKAGEYGGYVESEKNLAQEGEAWIKDRVIVLGDARVHGDAVVSSEVKISGRAEVYGNATVSGAAQITDDAEVSQHAQVFGNAEVSGQAQIYGDARVYGGAKVFGSALIGDFAIVKGSARVYGGAKVQGRSKVGHVADIFLPNHVLNIGTVGSRDDFVTFYKNMVNEISVSCGCFCGTLENFLYRVQETHQDNKYAQVYRMLAEVAKVQINPEEFSTPLEDTE